MCSHDCDMYSAASVSRGEFEVVVQVVVVVVVVEEEEEEEEAKRVWSKKARDGVNERARRNMVAVGCVVLCCVAILIMSVLSVNWKWRMEYSSLISRTT
jgi:hypothetical protein